MRKRLLVISNHPPDKWSDEQKKGWDVIKYVPFPNVPPEISFEEVKRIAGGVIKEIDKFLDESQFGRDKEYFCVQGEFTLCFIIYTYYKYFNFVFPTTERVVEEVDGKKISIFKFVRWR